MSTFTPLTTRGAFTPSPFLKAAPRAFASFAPVRSSAFTGGFLPAPNAASTASNHEVGTVAPEPSPALAPAAAAPVMPEPVATAAEQAQAAALAEAIRAAEATAADLIDRDRIRETEHQQLVADLEVQKARAKAATERLGQLAGELGRLRQAMLEEVRANAGTLLLLGARRLAGESLRAQPGLLESLVRDTVATLGGDHVTVRVNPEDVERVALAMGEGVRVVGDTSVRVGGIAEGDHGAVDATADTAAGSLLSEVVAWKRTA